MSSSPSDLLNPLDVAKLCEQFRGSSPIRYFCIDDFFREDFARELAASYPTFDEAKQMGHHFHWLNEDVKVQITEAARFPDPVQKVHELLASPEFMQLVSQITEISDLESDPSLAGGGMHVMGRSGTLGVHADFNMLQDPPLHRRLNILVYLSPDWREEWDGRFEMWDPKVKHRVAAIPPVFNRCVVFNTTRTSFHGVGKIQCPDGVTRNSFAGYYYTREAPSGWGGEFHNTLYKPRPGEWFRGRVLAPIENVGRRVMRRVRKVHRELRK